MLARKVAAVRDAVERVAAVLPASGEELAADRTVREVVTLNLFVAIQECVALATHWLADAGRDVPDSYGGVFAALAERGVLDRELARELSSAAGLRNLIAHQYAALDYRRIFELASTRRGDLLRFCDQLVRHAEGAQRGG